MPRELIGLAMIPLAVVFTVALPGPAGYALGLLAFIAGMYLCASG